MQMGVRLTPAAQTKNSGSYFGVFGEDVVHQAFVPGPEWPTAATHSCNTQTESERERVTVVCFAPSKPDSAAGLSQRRSAQQEEEAIPAAAKPLQ